LEFGIEIKMRIVNGQNVSHHGEGKGMHFDQAKAAGLFRPSENEKSFRNLGTDDQSTV
jgi:hypothetical protein